jgi:prepilin-type N-terminal cleavage/methylation domain-containing protein
MKHVNPRTRGYTLIELLIVIAMLGIAGALVIPSMGSTDVLRVQATVRAIVADINVAQSDALAHQQPRALIFDPATNTYVVIEVPGSTIEPTGNTIKLVDLNDRRRFHNSRLVSADFSGDPVLIFDELGGPVTDVGGNTPSSGGTIVISGSGSVFNINVEAYTGRVSVVRVSGP